MSGKKMLVTVIFGKQSTSLCIPAQESNALALLMTHIYKEFNVEAIFQRLVLSGRDVKSSTSLTDGCKLLLLHNQAYYKQKAFTKVNQTAVTLDTKRILSPVKSPSSEAPLKPLEIDVNDLDDDALLVQVFKGKAHYNLIFPTYETILEVKKKVSAVLELDSPQSLRLVIKGKIPKDDTVLDALTGNKKLIKAMVLLQAQQHVMQEKAEEFGELLNELANAQTALQVVQRKMAHNFMSRDESLFALSRVLDEAQLINFNLELIKQHFEGLGASCRYYTLATITDAIDEANRLTEVAQHLLETHSSFRD